MTHYKVTCDACAADLTATGNCVGYRIKVESERLPARGPSVTLMNVLDPLPNSLHFCGMGCLRTFLDRGEEKAT